MLLEAAMVPQMLCGNRMMLTGLPTIYNRQIECFNSKFWNPEFEAMDVFTVNWKDCS